MRALRPRRLGILLSLLATTPLLASPVGASHGESDLWIEWEEGGIPVVLLSPRYVIGPPDTLGCAGTVRLTFADGAVRTLPGVALGADACTPENPPCAPYEGTPGVVSCEPDRLVCCVFFTARPVDAEVGTVEVGCLRAFWVHVRPLDDAAPDLRLGPFFGIEGCPG